MNEVVDRVTVLAYFFCDDVGADVAFEKVAYALEQTWKWCGPLTSVLVVNSMRPCVDRFAKVHRNVSVQIEPSLIPGSLYSMSVDCISRLHERFETEYVLIVQGDGYPLRGGLSEFVGKWDFVGAPHIRNIWYLRLASLIMGFHPMNGGFSLRSKRCCKQAAYWWKIKYCGLGDCPETCEDWFYTGFLPKKEPHYKNKMRFPNVRTALRFAFEYIGQDFTGSVLPFGFHREKAFKMLQNAR